MLIKFNCNFCNIENEREVRSKSSFNRTKNHYCNNTCQNKNDKKRGVDKLCKAHKILKEKGHYKRDNNYLIGSNNPAWKGDGVGYSGLHAWIRSKLGKAKKCINGHKSTIYFWANVSGNYHRDILDWHELCNSCNQLDKVPVNKRFK